VFRRRLSKNLPLSILFSFQTDVDFTDAAKAICKELAALTKKKQKVCVPNLLLL
jgi:hypothetical protein